MTTDFIAISELDHDDLTEIYAGARVAPRGDELRGTSVALVFEHPSLRTRASSVASVQRLGGWPSMFTGDEVGLDARECAEDVARTLRATSSIAALRVRDHGVFARMARATRGELRLINLLSNVEHPTQAVADVLTLADHFTGGDVHAMAGLTVAYVGDANNVTRSLAHALVRLGVSLRIGAPEGYQFNPQEVAEMNSLSRDGATVSVTTSPASAVANVDAIYTDVWVSMGDEDEAPQRRRDLAAFQVNEQLVHDASPRAVILHCLPAHRGEEITEDVLESPRSLVWQQVRHRTSSMVGVLRWMKEKSR